MQAWDNVPEVFQGQDGCSDIRGKPRRAEADSLHVLHLPPIKKPRALWLSLPVSLSHSLTANYLLTSCLDLISLKYSLFLSLFSKLSLSSDDMPQLLTKSFRLALAYSTTLQSLIKMDILGSKPSIHAKLYLYWIDFLKNSIKSVAEQSYTDLVYNLESVLASMEINMFTLLSSISTLCLQLALVGSFIMSCLGYCCSC